jgi:preprotein translocase subunit YajC
VEPGARVRTTAGMYATVVDTDGDDVILEVAPGVEVRYMKRAIMEVVSPGDPVEDAYEADADAEDADTGEYGTDDADGVDDEAGDSPEDAEDADSNAYEKATGSKQD